MPSIRKCNRKSRKALARPHRYKGWTLTLYSRSGRGRYRRKVKHIELLSISPPRIKTELGIHDLRLPEVEKDPFVIGPLHVEITPISTDLQQWSDWQDKMMREIYGIMTGGNL